jgi:hypothetical protein
MSDNDDVIRPVGDGPDDPAYREEVQSDIAALLGRWGRGISAEPQPDSEYGDERVPADVWDRVLDGVQAERERAAAEEAGKGRRILPGGRWTTPLVAASAVALALVVGTTVLDRSGSQDPAVVADAPVSAEGSNDAAALATSPSPQIVQAGFVPPAKKVMALTDDLSADSIADTVDEILTGVGVEEPTDVLAMPEETWQPTGDGMTADPQVLRDCITKVTKVETSQALLVLRASVNGLDAGVIVVPEFMVDMNKMQGMDSEDMRRMGRQMAVTKIYVVEPTCGMGAPDHDPTLLQVAFSLTR